MEKKTVLIKMSNEDYVKLKSLSSNGNSATLTATLLLVEAINYKYEKFVK